MAGRQQRGEVGHSGAMATGGSTGVQTTGRRQPLSPNGASAWPKPAGRGAVKAWSATRPTAPIRPAA
jgi:hypothetical protein